MLLELSVRAYALLDKVDVSFENGFNVLTGETGAGKSLLIKAVGLILGEKGDVNSIRNGHDEAEVSAVLHVKTDSEAFNYIRQKEIAINDNTVVVRRILKRNGKNSIYINGYIVSREELSELSNLLFDMHGQHEHQALYHKENHRKILDKNTLSKEILEDYTFVYNQFKQKKEELANLKSAKTKNKEQEDFYAFALGEIDEAYISLEEKEELVIKLKNAEKSEKINKDLYTFYELTTAPNSSIMRLKEAMALCKTLDNVVDEELLKRFKSALLELEDASVSVLENKNKFHFNENELSNMQQKLSKLQTIEKRYGSSSHEKLTAFKKECELKLGVINDSVDLELDLKKEIKALELLILEKANHMSSLRKEKAIVLSSQIEESLQALEMKNCRFNIVIKPKMNSDNQTLIGIYGIDDVEFFFEPNIGGGNRPIKDIASGGEASRIMLALKSVLAISDETTTIVFDEIDTGIGGSAAAAVAKHIHNLACNKQLLVITHLASIASLANNHLKIAKQSDNDNTQTFINKIAGDERINEVARMLAGKVDEISREHAISLLNQKK